MSESTWLPNLVGGVSIWKLAVDLNEPKWFDGRLLIPETEGSDSLPNKVSWNVAGLAPLAEARAKNPTEVEAAIRDFFTSLERVSTEFAKPESPFHRFKDAFTVPALEADAGANYFYDAAKKRLFVINWGASPRDIAGKRELVFGYDDFGKLFEKTGIARAPAAAAPSAEAPQPAAPPGDAPKDGDKKQGDDKKKKEDKKPWLLWGRPWWHWALVLLLLLAILVVILLLLKGCENPSGTGADAGADGASAASDAGRDSGAASAADDDAGKDGGDMDAGKDASSDKDAGKDAGDDGGKNKDAGSDGGKDAGGKDGGSADNGNKSGNGPGGVVIVHGDGPGNGSIITIPAAGTQQGGGPRVVVYSDPRAVRWRVFSGKQFLEDSPAEGDGSEFAVALKQGAPINGVQVEWQDGSGAWHR